MRLLPERHPLPLTELLKGAVMHYDYVAIPDREVPSAVEPAFQHVVSTPGR
jgi:hypothetical protein